jgi:SAM-dependent methyltransferase
MVEIATRRHPATTFVEASVTELPFADEAFDAAVGNIVSQHVGEPERAARELARVLGRRGGVALSTWDAPERSPFFAALLGAIADAQVPPPSEIPPGPSFFQFADEAAFQSQSDRRSLGVGVSRAGCSCCGGRRCQGRTWP